MKNPAWVKILTFPRSLPSYCCSQLVLYRNKSRCIIYIVSIVSIKTLGCCRCWVFTVVSNQEVQYSVWHSWCIKPTSGPSAIRIRLSHSLCSIRKFNPKRGAPQFLVFKSCYVTELEKNTKFRKNPMIEKKVIHRFVCNANFRVCHQNKTKLLLSIFVFLLLFLVYGCL